MDWSLDPAPPQYYTYLQNRATLQSDTSVIPRSEPLLAILLAQNSLIGSAINGSRTVYSNSKACSPRFRYGAELVERFGSPLISTVETAGRIIGVNDKVRKWLQTMDDTADDKGTKRRRIKENGMDSYNTSRVLLDETLPAYDTDRSPTYEENQTTLNRKNFRDECPFELPIKAPIDQNLTTKLMIESSAFALSRRKESLTNLRFCLRIVQSSMVRVKSLIQTLTLSVKEWTSSEDKESSPKWSLPVTPKETSAAARRPSIILREIRVLNKTFSKIMSELIDVISNYTGESLPISAQNLVRRHLLTLPWRVLKAFKSSGADREQDPDMKPIRTAQKAIIYGQEAMGAMGQIQSVLQETILSVERWCDRLGRNVRSETDTAEIIPSAPSRLALDGIVDPVEIFEKNIKSEPEKVVVEMTARKSSTLCLSPEMVKTEKSPSEIFRSDNPGNAKFLLPLRNKQRPKLTSLERQ